MPLASPAVKVQFNIVPFLTADNGVAFGSNVASGAVSAADVRGYIASIEGYLWRKADGASAGLRVRLDAVKADGGLKHWLGQRDTPATAYAPLPMGALGPGVLGPLRTLDHIALDLKDAAGHTYHCAPIPANVAKLLDKVSGAERQLLQDTVALFTVTSCANGEAPIQTVCHLPPPQSTYRIDREQLSAAPAPRYWTYRLQKGGEANAGIELETGVDFVLADIRQAFNHSLASVPLKAQGQVAQAQGSYRRLSAPAWLRAILAA